MMLALNLKLKSGQAEPGRADWAKWDQTGPNRTKLDQMGPNGSNRAKWGPRGQKGHTGLKRAIRGQMGLIFCMHKYFYVRKPRPSDKNWPSYGDIVIFLDIVGPH